MVRVVARNLAIDLGSSNTLIYEEGRGVVLHEPTIAAVVRRGHKLQPIAFGAEAKVMLGKTPQGIEVVRPVRTGVVIDFDVATLMLNYFISEVRRHSRAFVKPKITVCVPCGLTEVERRAVRDSVENEGRDIGFIEQVMAAALGSNLDIGQAKANIVVDIGGGTTEAAVISLNNIVYSTSQRLGGDAMDEAIINYIRREYHLLIGEATAEYVKRTIGCATSDYDDYTLEVRGRSLVTGSPSSLTVSGGNIREAINEVVVAILGVVRETVENTPPELSGDLMASGVVLAGGGALLKGLNKRISEEIQIKVVVADDPIGVIVEGAGRSLDGGSPIKTAVGE